MAGLKRNLPESVSDENDKRRERKRIKAAMKAASDAYVALREMFNDTPVKKVVPDDIKVASKTKWVDAYIDQKIGSLENIVGTDIENVLPQGQVAFLKKQWENKRNKALEYVSVIGDLFKDYPSAKFSWGKYDKRIVCENLDDVVEFKTSVKVDDACKELFRLYANTTDDLARLNRYAKEHGFKPWDGTMIGMWKTPQEFVETWNIGGFSVKPTIEQAKRLIAEHDDNPRLYDRNGNPIVLD